jgi:Trypsin-like peptidase domain
MGVIVGHSQDHIPIKLVATNAATHSFLKVALIGVICLWCLRSLAVDGDKALALRQNVVKVWSGQGNTENGFGFIVSADAGSLYVITADHVAWGSATQPDAEAPSIYLAFYADPAPGNKYKAKIVKHDKNHDLALLQVQIPPGIQWEKQCLSTIEEAKRSTPVWFIGRDGEWFVPVLSGAIDSERPNADSWLEAEVPGLRPGSSGGPLVSRTGIVGMVDAGSADEARVLDIEYIKNAVQDWGYPWALTVGQDNSSSQPPALVPSDSVKSDPQQTPKSSTKRNKNSGITIYFDANLSTEEKEGYVLDSTDIVLSVDGTVFTKKLDRFHEHAAIEIPLDSPGAHNYSIFSNTKFLRRYVPGGPGGGFEHIRSGGGVLNAQDGRRFAAQVDPDSDDHWKMIQVQ